RGSVPGDGAFAGVDLPGAGVGDGRRVERHRGCRVLSSGPYREAVDGGAVVGEGPSSALSGEARQGWCPGPGHGSWTGRRAGGQRIPFSFPCCSANSGETTPFLVDYHGFSVSFN